MTYNVYTDSGDMLTLPIQCASCQRVPPQDSGMTTEGGKLFCDGYCQKAYARSKAREKQIDYQEGMLNVRSERDS